MDIEELYDEMQEGSDEDEYEELPAELKDKYERIHKKNQDVIRDFLVNEKQEQESFIGPGYYRNLLCWALKTCIVNNGWEITKVLGHNQETPCYADVYSDYGKAEYLIRHGYLLLEKDEKRIVAFISASFMPPPSVTVTGTDKALVQEFIQKLQELAKENNIYKGKRVEFRSTPMFLDIPKKNWDDLALDPAVKEVIQNNTVGFLGRAEELGKYGIPTRRGIILAGSPGTGKTLVNKILMNESFGITCIVARVQNIIDGNYISDLYEFADDVRPSMVFMEDIDLIGTGRQSHGRSPALSTLLASLDGVEECRQIVTIATTNFIEDIDTALKKRPSRFDRVIEFPLPSSEQRIELLGKLAKTNPLPADIQAYIASTTRDYTPAQIQDITFSLRIEHKHNELCSVTGDCKFTVMDVDRVLELIRSSKKNWIGFNTGVNRDEYGAVNVSPPALNSNKEQ